MVLLGLSLTHVKLSRLAVVIGESFRPDAKLGSLLLRRERTEALLGGLTGPAGLAVPGIRFVVYSSFRIRQGHVPVLLKMSEGTFGSVYWDMREVGAAEPF